MEWRIHVCSGMSTHRKGGDRTEVPALEIGHALNSKRRVARPWHETIVQGNGDVDPSWQWVLPWLQHLGGAGIRTTCRSATIGALDAHSTPTCPPLVGRRVGLRESVCSPRVVDHEAPGAVRLTTQHIRGFCRQLHRLTVRPGASERPHRGDEGEITCLEDPGHFEIEGCPSSQRNRPALDGHPGRPRAEVSQAESQRRPHGS